MPITMLYYTVLLLSIIGGFLFHLCLCCKILLVLVLCYKTFLFLWPNKELDLNFWQLKILNGALTSEMHRSWHPDT